MSSGRRRKADGDSDNTPGYEAGIPFRDGIEEIGEKRLKDIDTFVIPARDDKGAHTSVRFECPPSLYRQVQIILKSNRFPYLDVGHFMRHAMYSHIRWLVSIRYSLPRQMIIQLEAMMEVCREYEFRVQAIAAMEMVDKSIETCLNRMEIGEAVRLLNLMKDKLKDVPDSPKKRHILKELLLRYGYIFGDEGEVRQGTPEEMERERAVLLGTEEVNGAVRKNVQ
jgi:hypothetical protein